MPEFGNVIATNVRAERARLRMRQADLAEALGWSVSTVSDLESGKRTITASDLPKLCRVLGVKLDKLADGANAEDLDVLL